MTKKRHNIDTIAEVLIDKLNDMDKTALRIEKASQKELQINIEPFKKLFAEHANLISEQNNAKETILSDFKRFKEENKGRVPNYVFIALFVLFLGLISSIYFSYSSIKKVDLLERENAYYFEKLNELQKGKK